MENQNKLDSVSRGRILVRVALIVALIPAIIALLTKSFVGTDDVTDVSKEVVETQTRNRAEPTIAERDALLSVTHIEGRIHRWDVTIRREQDCHPSSDERRCCRCFIEAKGARFHPGIESAPCRALLLEVTGSRMPAWRDLPDGPVREAYLQAFSETFLAGLFYDVNNEERVSLLRTEVFSDNLELDPFE